ncbi:MAG: hypothetical protein RLZZ385_1103 [Pseudomonadota bacterium]
MKSFFDNYPPLFLLVNGILYCVVAWLFLTDPMEWFGRLSLQSQSSAGYTELRTIYVGLMGAVGIYLVIAAMLESLRASALLFLLLSYGGLAGVRAWGVVYGGADTPLMLQLLMVEVTCMAGSFLGLYCIYRIKSRRRNPYFM